MADDKTDLFKEFEQFLEQKRANEQEEAAKEDFDVEIWDEKGRGVRTRRSHAKPFLQSLGIDIDPPGDDTTDTDGDTTSKDKPKGSRQGSKDTGPKSVARKYFVKGQ